MRVNESTYPHPGAIIREEFMKPLGINNKRLSELTRVTPGFISTLLSGGKSISVRMAIKLGASFDTSAEFWLNLQDNYNKRNRRNQIRELTRSMRSELNELMRSLDENPPG